MGRPNLSEQRRGELLPIVAATFAEFGYRRATTALLAERCGVQETILYRLWADKRAMFTASIDYVAEHSERIWAGELARRDSAQTTAEAVLDHEAVHLGEFGLYRILFAGLSETDDPAIVAALRRAYRSFHAFLQERVREHRQARGSGDGDLPPAALVAWAMIGVGTAANLGRELELLPATQRAELLRSAGRRLLGS
ncbi:MAG: TetR/AcrR family transcriptional regulator [Planctomycetes bacterium]|nr:TetR/AcrR family transcriptional regulator [Planctomycetota bacterium]